MENKFWQKKIAILEKSFLGFLFLRLGKKNEIFWRIFKLLKIDGNAQGPKIEK